MQQNNQLQLSYICIDLVCMQQPDSSAFCRSIACHIFIFSLQFRTHKQSCKKITVRHTHTILTATIAGNFGQLSLFLSDASSITYFNCPCTDLAAAYNDDVYYAASVAVCAAYDPLNLFSSIHSAAYRLFFVCTGPVQPFVSSATPS